MIMPARVAIKQVRTLFAENPRFPGEGQSAQGKSAPKPRPLGVGDGKQARKFLYHRKRVITDEGTQIGRPPPRWSWEAKPVEGSPRQIRAAVNLERRKDVNPSGETDWLILCCQEKPLGSVSGDRTVNRHRWTG